MGQIQPAFINELLLEHSHGHLLMYCLWQPSCYNGKVSHCNKARNTYYMGFHRSLPLPLLLGKGTSIEVSKFIR